MYRVYNVKRTIIDVFVENKGRNRDFALIELDEVIDTDIFTPICLPSKEDNFRELRATLAGWGRVVSNVSISLIQFPEILQVRFRS